MSQGDATETPTWRVRATSWRHHADGDVGALGIPFWLAHVVILR